MEPYIEIFQDREGLWRWRLFDTKGVVIFVSSSSLKKGDAHNSYRLFQIDRREARLRFDNKRRGNPDQYYVEVVGDGTKSDFVYGESILFHSKSLADACSKYIQDAHITAIVSPTSY